MRNLLPKFVVGLLIGAVLSCGSPKQQSYEDESKTIAVSKVGGKNADLQRVTIPVGVSYGSNFLLGTPASAYSVDLAGCITGYSATVTEANVDGVEVYKDDRNCLAKLRSFTIGGVTYTNANPGATDFTTWLANDQAVFASAGGALIRVKVISQLPTPITGTEAIVYNFSELKDATSDRVFTEAEVSDPHSITVQSQEAPLFKVAAATYIGVNGTTGALRFQFKLECVNDPTLASPTSVAMTTGSGARTVCGSNDLNSVSYKLVKDTYSSVLTITNAETIFATAGATVTIPGDQYNDSPTNQGFNTSVLDGPGAIGTAGNEAMILIVKAGLSYTYYNVDVTTITQ